MIALRRRFSFKINHKERGDMEQQQTETQEQTNPKRPLFESVIILLYYEDLDLTFFKDPFFNMGFRYKNGQLDGAGCYISSRNVHPESLSINFERDHSNEVRYSIYTHEGNEPSFLSSCRREEGFDIFSRSQILLLTRVIRILEEHFPGILKYKFRIDQGEMLPDIPYRIKVTYYQEERDLKFSIEEGGEDRFQGKEEESIAAISLLEKSVFPYMTNQTLVDRIKNLINKNS